MPAGTSASRPGNARDSTAVPRQAQRARPSGAPPPRHGPGGDRRCPVDGGARCHDRERRPAVHPASPDSSRDNCRDSCSRPRRTGRPVRGNPLVVASPQNYKLGDRLTDVGTVRIALRNQPSSGAARTLPPICSPGWSVRRGVHGAAERTICMPGGLRLERDRSICACLPGLGDCDRPWGQTTAAIRPDLIFGEPGRGPSQG